MPRPRTRTARGRGSGPRPSAARTRGRRRPRVCRSCSTPKNIRAAASATTMYRNFRLDPTIQRNIARSSLLVITLSAELRLGAVQLGHPDRHDLGAGRRTVGEERLGRRLADDVDRGSDEDEGLGVRVHPERPVGVDEHRGVGHDQLRARRLDRDRLDAEPLGRFLGQRDAEHVLDPRSCSSVYGCSSISYSSDTAPPQARCRSSGEERDRRDREEASLHRPSYPLTVSISGTLTSRSSADVSGSAT